MKIRHQFVSNSSSTSYIIKVNPNSTTTCPCCGRSDLDFISYIKMVQSNYGGDDTEYNGNKTYIIERLEREIEQYEHDNNELYLKNPNSKAYEWQSSKTRVFEAIQQNKEHIEILRREIAKYSKFNDDEIHYITISYHDSNTNSIFKQCKNSGSITVLENFGD